MVASLLRGSGGSVRVLSHRSSVIHGFVTEPWHSRHVLFLCECLCFCFV